jgi:hypothetical protein
VISVDELRQMSSAERAELARALAALEPPAPVPAEADLPGSPRRRALALAAIVGCCLVLAAWTAVLALTLPRYYRSGGWRGAWVGFDIGLLITFAVTAWAGWRHRQLVIICLVILATLLCCDAWFDVTLDIRTSGFLVSLLMALCVELPLAALAVVGARRLMRLNIRLLSRFRGPAGTVPPLWRVPLYGMETRGFRNLIPAEPCFPADGVALPAGGGEPGQTAAVSSASSAPPMPG